MKKRQLSDFFGALRLERLAWFHMVLGFEGPGAWTSSGAIGWFAPLKAGFCSCARDHALCRMQRVRVKPRGGEMPRHAPGPLLTIAYSACYTLQNF
jgi:hypothetical protein